MYRLSSFDMFESSTSLASIEEANCTNDNMRIVSNQQLFTQDLDQGLQSSPAHHVVKHSYHDHANDPCEEVSEPIPKGGVTVPFPIRLHLMLDQIDSDGFASVVSWQPHGRCFVVHKPKEFVEKVMPKYFKQSKFPSFQRQLNLYGFCRLTQGPDKGGYYHELFLRGKTSLAYKIQRMKVKGTGVRARSNPNKEPNFYSMPTVNSCASTDASSVCDDGLKSPTSHSVTGTAQLQAPMITISSSSASASSDNIVEAATESAGKTPRAQVVHMDTSASGNNLPLAADGVGRGTVDNPDHQKGHDDLRKFLRRFNISEGLNHEILQAVKNDQSFGRLLDSIVESTRSPTRG